MDNMDRFKSLIKEALTKISIKYFQQPTIEKDRFKYGERVFCYELYHQLRCLQEKFYGLEISGEAVKSKFQSTDLTNNKIPDILIHNFGHHDNNEVIIEVKTDIDSFTNGIDKDFEILNTFTHEQSVFKYKLGISLVVNYDFEKFINENNTKAKELKSHIENNLRIELWNIKTPEFDSRNCLKKESIKVYKTHELHEILIKNCY